MGKSSKSALQFPVMEPVLRFLGIKFLLMPWETAQVKIVESHGHTEQWLPRAGTHHTYYVTVMIDGRIRDYPRVSKALWEVLTTGDVVSIAFQRSRQNHDMIGPSYITRLVARA